MPIDLDSVKEFLQKVREGATDNPTSFATTAISNFQELLDTALLLATTLENQTVKIRSLLEEDLAHVSEAILTQAIQSQQTTLSASQAPQYIPVPVYMGADGRPLANPAQPAYAPPPAQYLPQQQQQNPWAISPQQIIQQQQAIAAQQAQQQPQQGGWVQPPPSPAVGLVQDDSNALLLQAQAQQEGLNMVAPVGLTMPGVHTPPSASLWENQGQRRVRYDRV